MTNRLNSYLRLVIAMEQSTLDITQFILDLSEIPSSDPLVNLDVSKREVIAVEALADKLAFPNSAEWSKVLKTAAQNKRESDLDSLCLAAGTISWIYKEKEVVSPLVLFPVSWKLIKASGQLELVIDREAAFLNPFVKNRFIREFELNPAEIETDYQEWFSDFKLFLSDTKVNGTVGDLLVVGDFHHHRYQLLRELELLQQAESKSTLVQTILGNESRKEEHLLTLSPELLTAADPDQLEVFKRVAVANTVIQGPPGTGKSQVLTNLLGKSMAGEGLTLVVSEKKVALEVLVKKLGESKLEPFTFTVHGQTKPKEFIQQLKSTWNLLEESGDAVPGSLLLSDQRKDQLQMIMDKLNSPVLVGGVSFSNFKELLVQTDIKEAGYSSDVPGISEWIAIRPDLELLEELCGTLDVFTQVRQPLFAGAQFDRVIARLVAEAAFFKNTFSAHSIGELQTIYTAAARCQLVANESFKSYFTLYGKPKELKRFYKLKLEFTHLNSRLELLSAETKIWKTFPSRSQAVSWLKQVSGKQSWWKRRAFSKSMEAFLPDRSVDVKIALEQWLIYLEIREQKTELDNQFAQWGILRPELELESAAYVLQQLEREDPNELNRLAELPAGERDEIIEHAQRLKELLRDLDRYCILDPDSDLSVLTGLGEKLTKLLPRFQIISSLSPVVYRLLSKGKTLNELQSLVLNSNWRLLEARFPELSKFDGTFLHEKLDEILQTENSEFDLFARSLLAIRKQRFGEFAQLLRTPAAQLKGDRKLLKAKLKAGKSILVKEFGKSKQHQTIRELLSGDARIWIELLTPVWLSTPAQVGKAFPMEKDLFNLVIFDEASQIPLPNALGSLQRSKRAVIAGDEQQMAPASYFSGGKPAVDLLHQASFYWSKIPLKHHYRSVHPALIAFSNRHFYDNELVAFPSPESGSPIHRHFIEEGVYDERINKIEATEVASFLESVSWDQSIGIAAFSEQQLDCVWKACTPLIQEKITSGQEKNTVFFKALEQIQGDECDLLVVSMGYGKNPEGGFHLRFGPLNQGQGYKRLNVLLTRAKKELHFFTSVKAADLAISSNESVNLLRLFLNQLEQPVPNSELMFPYGLIPQSVKGKKLELPAVYSAITSSRELATFHRVMKQRGWKLSYG